MRTIKTKIVTFLLTISLVMLGAVTLFVTQANQSFAAGANELSIVDLSTYDTSSGLGDGVCDNKRNGKSAGNRARKP